MKFSGTKLIVINHMEKGKARLSPQKKRWSPEPLAFKINLYITEILHPESLHPI